MEITLTDRFKLKTCDALNMQLYERREVKDTYRTERAGEVDWMPCGNYFPDVESAVMHVYKRMQRDSEYDGDLAGAVDELRAIAHDLKESAKGAAA